jgi:hypothetical protein
MHMLLKWNPDYEDDTCDQHRATAGAIGSTWWGCWSVSDERRIAPDRLARLEEQLGLGVTTWAYVYRLGAQPEVWQARVLNIVEDESLTDQRRRPAGMTFDGCFLFVELADFTEIDTDWPSQHLALWDRPSDGALQPGSLHNQTTPMYVVELGP